MVSQTDASSDVELFEAFTDVLKLLMRHLGIKLSTEGGADEINIGNYVCLLIQTSHITLVRINGVLLSKHVLERTVINFDLGHFHLGSIFTTLGLRVGFLRDWCSFNDGCLL